MPIPANKVHFSAAKALKDLHVGATVHYFYSKTGPDGKFFLLVSPDQGAFDENYNYYKLKCSKNVNDLDRGEIEKDENNNFVFKRMHKGLWQNEDFIRLLKKNFAEDKDLKDVRIAWATVVVIDNPTE